MTRSVKQSLSWISIVVSVLLLGGCGFQLRGSHDYPFKHLYIANAPSQEFRARLKRLVEAGSDTVVLPTPAGADAILSMSSGTGQSVLSYDKTGVAQEYVLTASVGYSLITPSGTVLIPTSVINVNRAMTYSNKYALAKQSEADLLQRDMYSDIADQLLRRLDVVRTLNPSEPVPGVAPRAPLPTPPL